MVDSLYDLLEVAPTASGEVIHAAYQRLHAKLAAQIDAGDPDITNRMIALREAFGTLSDPARRQRYDARLAERLQPAPAAAHPNRWLLLALMLALGGSWFAYAQYQGSREAVRLERERLEIERQAAEARLAEIEAQRERAERQAADEAERRRRVDEAYEKSIRERDRAYGNAVSRNVEYAEAQANQARQREEQLRVEEARQQLAREKAYLRQREAANSRW
jgi:curved DNA-binding protein CbpA